MTVDMNLGQTVPVSFSIQDNNGKTVPSTAYSVSASFSDPSIASYSNGGPGTPPNIQALKLGSTQVTYTVTGNAAQGYSGSITIGPDTINVDPKTLASGTVSYGTPQ